MERLIVDKETGEFRYTTKYELIHHDNDYRCWNFKECSNLTEYLKKYMNNETSEIDIEESSYQYLYDESEDWLYNEWTSSDIERAFKAGAMWMKLINEKSTN